MSQADVSYSCGSCGYPLNLASSNRLASEIGSKYRKSIKKGSISFESIDLSRFTQLDEPSCFPICLNHHGSKTKLLCRQCGVQIGYGYGDAHAMHDIDSSTIPNSNYKQIVIKIRALQPLDTADQLSTNEDDQASCSFIMQLPDDCLFLIFEKFDSSVDRESFGLTCHRLLHIQNSSRKSLEFGCSFSQLNHSLSKTTIDVDSFILDKLINRFRRLELLSLCGCVNLLDSGLSQLQNYGSKLKSLYLDCCFKVTDTGLSSVAIGCPNLSFISLYRCSISDNGLELLAKSCLFLKDLNIEWCSLITDSGISSITNNCRELRAIKISHCGKIKGVGFEGCSQTLACLEADFCKLEPEGIKEILSGGGLEYLNVSSLGWCIRGDGLRAIGGGFGKNLRTLNLRLCRTVGDATIMEISEGCPLLKEWNLSLCTEVRLSGWESIGTNCHNLERLHVNGCRGLCDRGLLALRDGCERLSVIYITRCQRVSSLAMTLFKMARWDVEMKHEEVMCIMPKHFF